MPEVPELLTYSLKVIGGILLLFLGGDQFVKGSVKLAALCRIPQLVIGLTVVAFGTSAPELFVSISSILQDVDDLAVSNVVGSNIFNILVVLGCSALVLPLRVENRLVRRDVPVLLAISSAAWGMASAGRMTWQAGIALLIGLVINTVWEIRTAREEHQTEPQDEPLEEPLDGADESSTSTAERGGARNGKVLGISLLQLLIGITLLVVGSRTLVSGATAAAEFLNVPTAVIGLTIVATGTSTPELITSVVATMKGRTDLAVGNVVGSCLLNLLMVLGGCAAISGGSGLQVNSELITEDLPVMMIATLVCLPIFWTRRSISRIEGGILLTAYVLYITDNVLPRTSLASWQDEFRLAALCVVLPFLAIVIITQVLMYLRMKQLE